MAEVEFDADSFDSVVGVVVAEAEFAVPVIDFVVVHCIVVVVLAPQEVC